MMPMNNTGKTLKISILGKSYTVVTDEHDADVYAAVEEVEKLFQNKGFQMPQNYGPNADKLAAIVAMQVAMELVKAKKVLERYENICAGLMGKIEQSL
ncbi:cell division protein ZapA [Candidatus Dependentiae bacterium]|nr:cell division protein ZapA [Candidatus Dependentiae bacterium]